MILSEVLSGLPCSVTGAVDGFVTGVAYDSRLVTPGDIFVALPGHHVQGSSYFADAVKRGAVAVVTDHPCILPGIPVVLVDDSLRFLARISAIVYGHPDKRLLLAGITGTNGKTTITYLLESIFSAAHRSMGVIGTVNYRFGTTKIPAPNTTPQSADIYRMLQEMVSGGITAAVMEVSSHALALGRVDGLEFDLTIFTNLTRDHLDFHGTMENYFSSKALLFSRQVPGEKPYHKCAIINTDDSWGKKLSTLVTGASVVTYGLSDCAHIRAENIHYSSHGTEFTLITPTDRCTVTVGFLGSYNVYNILAAVAAGICVGIPFETVVDGVRCAPPAPGRLEPIDGGQPFTVLVDYAHTDDALLNVLRSLRELNPARIITVFGCGGDRDTTKRSIMGETASRLSDHVFLTSDNPRSEDPKAIARDVEEGFRRRQANNYEIIIDREQAIAAALAMARAGDIVLLAGKGHEMYQIIGEQKLHFNDGEIARVHLERLYGKH
ncbi:MAG: UDP-N-acetylmuramoyl-L-alanyl-D-glutamate--2,6-diaminopimelate ligase [Elusimicrobia bacterium]|nr:UDP-N-acetylmuramoyl-L-alanyl-D-glutamate--2,6-diaminopimelate ligase [Elusimicrobiota bacterium]